MPRGPTEPNEPDISDVSVPPLVDSTQLQASLYASTYTARSDWVDGKVSTTTSEGLSTCTAVAVWLCSRTIMALARGQPSCTRKLVAFDFVVLV